MGQAVERDEGDRVRGHDVRGGHEPAQPLLEAKEGEGPPRLHREDLAVEDVPPRRGREGGHDLGELRGELAPIPREEPDSPSTLWSWHRTPSYLSSTQSGVPRRRIASAASAAGWASMGSTGVKYADVRRLEASPAGLERDRAEVRPVTVRGAHRRDRLAGRVGDGVLERLLLHADPRLAEHRLDERPDRARVQPAKRVPEQRGLGPGASRGVERLEARRHVASGTGPGSDGAAPAQSSAAASPASAWRRQAAVTVSSVSSGRAARSAASSVAPPTARVRPSPRGKGRPPR